MRWINCGLHGIDSHTPNQGIQILGEACQISGKCHSTTQKNGQYKSVTRVIKNVLRNYQKTLQHTHWRNFTSNSGGDQWRRQDLVSAGHDDRGAEGASIKAPKAPSGVGYGEECPLPSRLGGLGERRELPQQGPGRSPGRYRIFCIF